VFFHRSVLENARFDDLQEGVTVEYEMEESDRGPRATAVRLSDRFLNPYNFVRPLDGPRPKGHVLGNCPPPPHDRYVPDLLTGRITCEVTAVTPLFISDAHGIEGRVGEHRTFRFFEYEGRPAIPASSLRGMIRSVFEAVTNSCFAVFDPGRLDHREARVPKGVVPARVVEITKEGARLELLDAGRGYPAGIYLKRKRDGRPIFLLNCAMVSAYEPHVLDPDTEEPFDPRLSILPSGACEGMRVAALINSRTESKGVYQYFRVHKIAPIEQQGALKATNGMRKVFGYLHITGPNIEKKHFERLFFRWDDQGEREVPWDRIPRQYRRMVGKDVVEEYNAHLREYWERNERQVRKLGDKPWQMSSSALPHPSNFIEERRKLQPGDLVYYIPTGPLGSPLLRPVSIARQPFKFSRGEVLQNHAEQLERCRSYDLLCPACRVLGWVHEDASKLSKKERVAYAGRVRLSHGVLKEDKGKFDATLAILSTPKPTTTQFYLLRKGRPDGRVTYDGPDAQLRGRKFYRHHGDEPSKYAEGRYEYQRVGNVRDDQNRSVRGVLKKGAIFEFDLEFENLHPLELGALLWALELEPGMHHRLGYGKPLGFGSVTLRVTGLKVLNTAQRYSSLSSDGWEDRLASKEEWVSAFAEAMRAEYGAAFDGLLAELRAILGAPSLPVHYPREAALPTKEGENFRWFVKNKRRRDPHPLGLAAEDGGLPISP